MYKCDQRIRLTANLEAIFIQRTFARYTDKYHRPIIQHISILSHSNQSYRVTFKALPSNTNILSPLCTLSTSQMLKSFLSA